MPKLLFRSPTSTKKYVESESYHSQKGFSTRGAKGKVWLSMMSAVFLINFACSSGSDFSGSSGKKSEKSKAKKDEDKDQEREEGKDIGKNGDQKVDDPSNLGKSDDNATKDPMVAEGSKEPQQAQLPPPEKCDPASGATFANLLSPLVVLGTNTSEMVYEIAITDCAGKVKNINAESISFDFDGELGGVGIGAVLQYRLVAEGVTHTGVLEARDGQDLFGNKGSTFYHFITSQKVSTSTKSSSVRLAISLVNKDVRPRDSVPGGAAAEFKMKTFLRFGSATPVTKEVTFKPFGAK